MIYTCLHAHTCMISRTQQCTNKLPRTYARTSVSTADTSTCRCKHLYLPTQTPLPANTKTSTCRYKHLYLPIQTPLPADTNTSTCRYKHLYLPTQTPVNISFVKELTEHNISEMCINSLGWYNANTV